MKKKILIGLLAILVIIQFIRIDKTPEFAEPELDLIAVTNPPKQIQTMLKTSCYDCHSNQTKYPWYSNIAPISWWIKDHIDHAKGHLNFSIWAEYPNDKALHKLEECVEMLENKEMPLPSYLIMHGDADLNEENRNSLIAWFESLE